MLALTGWPYGLPLCLAPAVGKFWVRAVLLLGCLCEALWLAPIACPYDRQYAGGADEPGKDESAFGRGN